MGTNSTKQERAALPAPMGPVFAKLYGDSPMTLTQTEVSWLLTVIGTVEHLRFYASGYAKMVCRELFKMGDHEADFDASRHMDEVVDAITDDEMAKIISASDPKGALKRALARVVTVLP